VPLDALYKTWHIYPRMDHRYYVADLITDILSGGGSSRLYQSLVKEQKLFSNIECYHFGTLDAGLLAIDGKLVKGVKMADAENAVAAELQKLTGAERLPWTETLSKLIVESGNVDAMRALCQEFDQESAPSVARASATASSLR
jgi:predicted Zn-dependent peptidase